MLYADECLRAGPARDDLRPGHRRHFLPVPPERLSKMPIALFALSLAAFAIGTTEFIIAGLLPDLSASFGVSIPTAGLLVTAYAVAVAIGGPVLALLTARLPRKPMIVGLLAVFTLGQAFCALAPSYPLLMAARIFVACGHGLFYGIASVAAADLVPKEKRGAALALFLGGITVANVLGVPAGTAIGNAFGWRWAFWAIGGFGLAAALLVAWLLPPGRPQHEEGASIRAELAELRHQEVYLSFLVIGLYLVGTIGFSTYQVPVMTRITGIPQVYTPYYLIVGGIGTIVGIYAGGRAADWRLMPSLISGLILLALAAVVMFAAMHNPISMVLGIFLMGVFGFTSLSPTQKRIIEAANAAPNFAATLISTAANIGIALGAGVGALWIDHGLGYESLPAIPVLCSLLAAGIALLSWSLERRRQLVPT
jgi:DHA1 family inner membrane transport protein